MNNLKMFAVLPQLKAKQLKSREHAWARTREVPWIEPGDVVDDGDDGGRQRASQGLPAEVQQYQLLVGGVKPEPRRQLRGRLRRPLHCTAEPLCSGLTAEPDSALLQLAGCAQ
jgi:hypothetical protein